MAVYGGGDAISNKTKTKKLLLNRATKIRSRKKRRNFDGRLLIGLWPRKKR